MTPILRAFYLQSVAVNHLFLGQLLKLDCRQISVERKKKRLDLVSLCAIEMSLCCAHGKQDRQAALVLDTNAS